MTQTVQARKSPGSSTRVLSEQCPRRRNAATGTRRRRSPSTQSETSPGPSREIRTPWTYDLQNPGAVKSSRRAVSYEEVACGAIRRREGGCMSAYTIKPLDASTWDAFERLAEKHNGMGFGGCWCTWFHSRIGKARGRKRPPLEGASRSRGQRSRGPRLRPRRRGGLVPIRLSGGAPEHPPPEAIRSDPHG